MGFEPGNIAGGFAASNIAGPNFSGTGGRGPGFDVAGVGHASTLTDLITMLNAHPTANVTQLGNYNAATDGTFSSASAGLVATTYTGTFDGQGYMIKNITAINSSAGANVGLFARIGAGGTVKNVTVSGSFTLTATNLFGLNGTTPNANISAISQANPGQITLSTAVTLNTGSVITVSGVVGMTQVNGQSYTVTKIDSTHFTIGVDTTGFTAYISGGAITAPVGVNTGALGSLAGQNDGLIQNCSTTATLVSNSPGSNNGGLVGFNSKTGVIDGGTNTVNVSLTSYAYSCYLGHVVGQNWGEIKNVTVVGGASFSPSGNMPVGVTNFTGSNVFAGPWQGCLAAANGGNSGGGTLTTALVHNNVVTGNPSVVGCQNFTSGAVGITGVGIGINLEGKVYSNTVTGNVSGGADVGVMIGRQSENDSQSYDNVAVGNATGVGQRVGVICGHATGTIKRCSGSGNATGTINVAVGIGWLDDQNGAAPAAVDHLICVGNATATDVAGHCGVGIGLVDATATFDQLLCFGVATATAGVGAVAGSDQNNAGSTNTYFCLESAGTARGVGNISNPTGVHGQLAAQLRAGMPSGFDATWSQSGGTFGGFPYINTIAPPTAPVIPSVNIVSFVARSTSTGSTTIAMPAGIQAGDYALIFDLSQNIATTGIGAVTPAGWTDAITSSTSVATHGTRASVYQRVLDGTETNVVGMSVGTRDKIMECLVFRTNFGATMWTVSGVHNQTNGAGSGIAAQSISVGTKPCFMIGRAISDGGTFASPMLSTGDDVDFAFSGAVLLSQSTYQIENFSASPATFTGDTTHGSAAASCVVSAS